MVPEPPGAPACAGNRHDPVCPPCAGERYGPSVARIEIPDEVLARLDALVAEGSYPSRGEALAAAVAAIASGADPALADAFRRMPETDEERRLSAWSTRESIAQEPW